MFALVLAAFVAAGFKAAHLPGASDFAVPPALASTPGAVQAGIPASGAAETLRHGTLRFTPSFVSASPGQAVHAASAVELRNGGLRAVWFSGSREGAGDVSIRTAVMDPVTFRWSPETTVIERLRLEQGLWRYVKKLGNPVIARGADGSLYLWLVNVSLGGWAGSAISWVRSTDEGLSWSAPRRLVASPFINISTLVKGAPVVYEDGTIGLPVYHEFIVKFAEILRMDPAGRVIDKIRIPGSLGNLQPVVLATDARHAQVYMRSGDATSLKMSATSDGGQSWRETAATRWPNPDSALAGVVAAAAGGATQWIAINPDTRTRETLAVLQAPVGGSFDAAQPVPVESSPIAARRATVAEYAALLTAELASAGSDAAQARAYVDSARRQLCHGETCAQEFSYPYMIQGRDGQFHLLYTWHRTRIKHVRFDPRQPAAGEVPRP